MPNKTSDETLTACKEKHKSEEEDEKKKWKNMACIVDCYFKEKGALKEDGSFVNEKVVELAVAGAAGDEDWSAVMKTSAETCLKKCGYFIRLLCP
jgi:hypothetical protein